MSAHSLLRGCVTLGTVGALAALVAGCPRRPPELALAPGQLVMDRCPPRMVLVVTNETSYPIQVLASQATSSVAPGSGVLLTTVPSGGVDTIGVEMRAYQRVGFESTQPASNGRQPPLTGLSARCVRTGG